MSRFTRKEAGAVLIAAVVTLGLGVLPAGASGAVLYDQTGFPSNAGSITSSIFTSDLTKAAQGADDFTVPAGASWQISSVDVLGSGASGLTAGVYLYANNGSLPGAQLFQQTGIPVSGGLGFSAPIGGAPALGPGTYWVSVQTSGSTQWSWSSTQSAVANQAVWRNPPNGYGKGCIAYTTLSGCTFAPAANFLFRLNAADPVPVPTTKKKCKKKKHKRAAVAKKRKCKKKKKR